MSCQSPCNTEIAFKTNHPFIAITRILAADSMQEQQQMIETMKKRMDALEEQNKLLQQLVNKKN